MQLDLQLIGILVTLIGTAFSALFWALKWLLEKYTAANALRLSQIEALVSQSSDKSSKLEREIKEEIQSLWREFMQFQTDAAINYVRREDHIRAYQAIESRLETLGERTQRIIERLGERKLGAE